MSMSAILRNEVQLITYVDRLGGGGFAELGQLLDGPLGGLFGGVHLLPFYYPIDRADAGFDPIDHTRVDERLGAWDDLDALGREHDLVADVIVNHISAASHNLRDRESPFPERSVYYDRLTQESIDELRALVSERSMEVLTEINRVALRLADGDEGKTDAINRMTLGYYYFSAADEKAPGRGDLTAAGEPAGSDDAEDEDE